MSDIEARINLQKDIETRIKLQNDEFDKLDDLINAYRSLPAVVDDDYPRMRYGYDAALRTFIAACHANGRLDTLKDGR